LSVVFAFLFEHAVLLKAGHLLESDHLQFGFKPKHSTSHAIYVMQTYIDCFCSHGSNVFAAFLDCSKGFDKVDHNGIFIKLINRNVPLCYLCVLMYWYLNLTAKCKWGNVYSEIFSVDYGVRQGGVLSPRIFAIYIDDFILELRGSNLGCYIIEMFVAAILYADDLALLASTRSSLQGLLDICESYGIEWCISYNSLKTKVMIVWKARILSYLAFLVS
jgi:hypothetical protein